MASKFEFNITEEIAVISDKNGYTKELNMISYNGAPPKLDLRNWSVDEDGEKRMGKGLTLSTEEAIALRDALEDLDL